MSMGGGSSDVTPVRRSTTPRQSTSDEEETQRENYNGPAVQEADPSLPTYVAVGGGLSNTRIIAKMPEEIDGEAPGDCTLEKVVKYMMSPDISVSEQDQTVVEAVRERIVQNDCRVVLNNFPGLGTPYNYSREHLQDKLGDYLVRKTQNTATGQKDVNFTDIAILTHDEGGYNVLEKLCE